jgi:hypothetical protein
VVLTQADQIDEYARLEEPRRLAVRDAKGDKQSQLTRRVALVRGTPFGFTVN